LKENSNYAMRQEQRAKPAMSQRPVQRETKEVLAELVEKLTGKLELKARTMSEGKGGQRAELGPHLDRLTAAVEGETLSEGQVQTAQPDEAEFFQALAAAGGHRIGNAFRLVPEIIAAKGTRCWWPIRG
jgi:hypothetical protein